MRDELRRRLAALGLAQCELIDGVPRDAEAWARRDRLQALIAHVDRHRSPDASIVEELKREWAAEQAFFATCRPLQRLGRPGWTARRPRRPRRTSPVVQ